jgi:hypothetical protein
MDRTLARRVLAIGVAFLVIAVLAELWLVSAGALTIVQLVPGLAGLLGVVLGLAAIWMNLRGSADAAKVLGSN